MKNIKNAMSYIEMESESEIEFESDPSDWPQNGKIEFNDVWMKYKGASRYALKGVNFCANAKDKVGIKGRTGGGKSSIVNTLFRLYDIDCGEILIDWINISTVGLHCLRSNISYLPQVPFLMFGTIRENLDPLSIHDDEAIILALKDVQLWEYIEQLKDGLLTEITQSNMIFSTGQKQLICLARAILQNKKILIFDEATANIDYNTDQIIQDTIRRKFKDCTVIAIAHRISTISDSDNIIMPFKKIRLLYIWVN